MSTNYTEHYQLCLWEEDDSVQRTDFNEDNEKIEQALKKKAEQSALDTLAGQVEDLFSNRILYAYGSYEGTGEWQTVSSRLDFDFKPLLVIVSATNSAAAGYPWINGQKNGRTGSSSSGTSVSCALTWEDRSVSWVSTTSVAGQLNTKGATYYYFALGVRE